MRKQIVSHSKSRSSLLFGVIVSIMCVFAGAVSTFAWFQVTSSADVETESDEADITVQAPDDVKFYYFTGNGTPGGDYSGYSRTDSAIGLAPRTIAHDGSTNPASVGFSSGTYSFVEIDGTTYTAANCFNFSKIRPGCYYSFCVKHKGANDGLKLTFADGTTGASTTPKRRIGNSGSSFPASLGVALNGYASTAYSTADAAKYIKEAFNAGETSSASDKIVYNSTNAVSPAASAEYIFATGVNTSASEGYEYIFFTVWMGFNDKSDALLYNSKSGSGASEIIYYTRGQTTGDYSALNGLSMTLTKVQVTLA